MPEATMLEVRELTVRYGRNVALDAGSIRVGEGEIVALVGANGAGKSTLLKGITGHEPAAGGSVVLHGRDVTTAAAQQRVALGMALVPEGRGMFADMTVAENLELGAFLRRGAAQRRVIEHDRAMVLDLFPRLGERMGQRAGSLSGGEQQMLAIGRALMTAPRLLILDEPSLGLAPRVLDDIVAALRHLHAQHSLSVLVAEQNAALGLGLASRGYVLHAGRIVLEGSAQDLAARGGLVDFYLGSALEDLEKEQQ